MNFSVSIDGFECFLDFGSNSVTLIVKNLIEKLTINSQESLLTAWSLLLSKRKDFLNNNLARVPITLSQQGTIDIPDEVISGLGAQDMDTSGNQVFDLEKIEFHC